MTTFDPSATSEQIKDFLMEKISFYQEISRSKRTTEETRRRLLLENSELFKQMEDLLYEVQVVVTEYRDQVVTTSVFDNKFTEVNVADRLGISQGSIGQILSRNIKVKRSFRQKLMIEGKEYASLTQASKELGLFPVTISNRCRSSDWKDWYYQEDRDGLIHVVVDGKPYPSKGMAAYKTKLYVSEINRRCLSTDYPDYYEVTEENREAITALFAQAKALTQTPVSINGKIYPSKKEAARALGEREDYVAMMCRSPNFPNAFEVKETRIKEHLVPEKNIVSLRNFQTKKKVRIDGIVYDDAEQAADALGISLDEVMRRCSHPNFPTWNYTRDLSVA